jgi:hypothetical protein
MALTSEQLRARIRQRLDEQRVLVAELLARREQLQGSLFARYGSCGKDGCACRTGRGHGPYYVLSTRSRGQGGFAYLDSARAAQARRLVRAHRDFRQGVKRLGSLNLALVALLRRYQESRTQQSGRRLGLLAGTLQTAKNA